MGDTSSSAKIHEELRSTRPASDASDVEKIVNDLENQYQNPIHEEVTPSTLVNIVTGKVATKEVEDHLTALKETAKSQMVTFAVKRWLQQSRTTSFWDTPPKSKTTTFTDMRKPLTSLLH